MVIQSISPTTVSMQFGGQIRKDLGVQTFIIRVSASLSQFVYQARGGQDGEILGPGNSKKVWASIAQAQFGIRFLCMSAEQRGLRAHASI